MNAREQDGFVVIPLGQDGKPLGRADWYATGDEAARAYIEATNRHGAYVLGMWRTATAAGKHEQ